MPPVLKTVADERRGLILVTGTTGSGKSTSLAAMIDYINTTRTEHIMTIEDPIEFLHRDKKSLVNQREVEVDTKSFSSALRSALRQDPDVILVGEMRDYETIETALNAAETGHLVLSTLHTLDATETINRIISVFPPHQQKQIRLQLAAVLKSAISMRLLPRADGTGRVPAVEVMRTTNTSATHREQGQDQDDPRGHRAGHVAVWHADVDQSIYQLYKRDHHHGGSAAARLQPGRVQAQDRADRRDGAARDGSTLRTGFQEQSNAPAAASGGGRRCSSCHGRMRAEDRRSRPGLRTRGPRAPGMYTFRPAAGAARPSSPRRGAGAEGGGAPRAGLAVRRVECPRPRPRSAADS